MLDRLDTHRFIAQPIVPPRPNHTFNPPPVKKKSFQFKALAFKAFAHQKRQTLTNVFCLVICPFLVVFLSSVLGTLANKVLRELSAESKDVLYCSNTSALDVNGWPLKEEDPGLPVSSDVPHSHGRSIKHMNLFVSFKEVNDRRAFLLHKASFCEHWFGQKISLTSQPELSWDSAFRNPPKGGWLSVLLSGSSPEKQAYVKDYLRLQMRPWAIYGGSKQAMNFIQELPSSPFMTNLSEAFNFVRKNKINFTNKPGGNVSFFETIEQRLWTNTTGTNIVGFQQVPYFIASRNSSSPAQMDTMFGRLINSTIHSLSLVNKSVLFQSSPRPLDLGNFYEEVDEITQRMPYGGIWFNSINYTNLSFDYTLQIGTDKRLQAAPTFPTRGRRLFLQQAQLTNAFLRQSNKKKFGDTVIVQGTRIFPQLAIPRQYPVSAYVGKILYPLGLSCLMPVFVVTLVKEKESRLRIMMRMNGVKLSMYILINYLTFLLLFSFSAASFLITGYLSDLAFFQNTSFGVLLSVIYNWGHLLICLSMLFSVFFKRSRRALIVVFLLLLCTILIAGVFQHSFPDSIPAWVFFIWPPWTFYHALNLINTASYTPHLKPYEYADLKPGNELYTTLLVIYGQTTLCFALVGYFSYVLPSEYGVRKPWHYALNRVWRQFMGFRKRPHKSRDFSLSDVERQLLTYSDLEDDLVRAEREKILQNDYEGKTPLVVKNISKVFTGRTAKDTVAVRSVTFSLEDNTILGLLGGNGAGKSSLIGMLTGLFEITSGSARIAGFDMKSETKFAYQNMGICPQSNLLWEFLTVQEHLLFYARIKGFTSKEEKLVVQSSLETVELTGFESRLISSLSHGEKRRLAIAIAIVGDPKVIFLDEPTKDLDPIMKRQIWNIVLKCKKDRAVIMTTHSMEEAEVCCQKFAIMSNGCLSTIGSLKELREFYGAGYKLCINGDPRAECFVESLLKRSYRKSKGVESTVKYEFELRPGNVADIFYALSQSPEIKEWKLTQTSLEDIFMTVAGQDSRSYDQETIINDTALNKEEEFVQAL